MAPELADRYVLKRMDGPQDDTVLARRRITLEDVLSFRLGWGIDFDPKAPFMKAAGELPGFGMPNPAWPGDDNAFLRELGRLPLQAQPGERWLYTLGATYSASSWLGRRSGHWMYFSRSESSSR